MKSRGGGTNTWTPGLINGRIFIYYLSIIYCQSFGKFVWLVEKRDHQVDWFFRKKGFDTFRFWHNELRQVSINQSDSWPLISHQSGSRITHNLLDDIKQTPRSAVNVRINYRRSMNNESHHLAWRIETSFIWALNKRVVKIHQWRKKL